MIFYQNLESKPIFFKLLENIKIGMKESLKHFYST